MMQRSTFSDSPANSVSSVKLGLSSEQQRVLSFLLPLSNDYPGIDGWFTSKVAPGVVVGSRKILTYERNGQLVAVGIAKKDPLEKKICTVRVDQSYFGRGLGVRVFADLMNWLDEEQPVLTVSNVKLPSFQRIFDHFGFVPTSATPNLYRLGSTEIGFNETGLLKSEHN